MNPVIFRQYDIRGIVGVDLFVETTYDLGRAIVFYFHKNNPHKKTVVVGMDVRTHSPALHTELVRALLDSGYTVIDLDVCTTPMLYFATQRMHCAGGVMITASHNPKEYNGFKIVLGSDAIWGTPIQEIKKLYLERASLHTLERGSYTHHNISEAYCTWLLEQFPALQNSQMLVAFDCANGATSVIMPQLVEKFGWRNAQLLYATPDGMFPNHPADPIEMHTMQDLWQHMQKNKITLGIGFDGDGDRMDALDETGFLVPGDQLLAIFTCAIAQEKKKSISMACDITASAAVVEYVQKHGVSVVMAPCGIGSIKQHMREHNAPIGGELSCHFIFNDDRGPGFDDGIYAALRLLEIVVKTGQSLAALRAELPVCVSSPQYRIACKEESKKQLVQSVMERFQQRADVHLITIDGARIIFPYGWGLVRPSNTLPVMVFRFEASNAVQLAQLKKEFADLLAVPLESDLHTLFGLQGSEI